MLGVTQATVSLPSGSGISRIAAGDRTVRQKQRRGRPCLEALPQAKMRPAWGTPEQASAGGGVNARARVRALGFPAEALRKEVPKTTPLVLSEPDCPEHQPRRDPSDWNGYPHGYTFGRTA